MARKSRPRIETEKPADLLERVPGLEDVLRTVLRPIASLKLTIVLFSLAIFLVLAGTLAQYDKGDWTVIGSYFRCWLAHVDFKDLVPGSFFPDRAEGPIGFGLFGKQINGFYFPGGWTIGTLMLLNLMTAHALRFKVQARGSRLITGLGVLAAGALVTILVIMSGSNAEGFQQSVWAAKWDWDTLWTILKWGLGAVWVAVGSTLLKIQPEQKAERWSIFAITALIGLMFAGLWIMGDSAKLDPSGMRILWQLMKGLFAGAVLLAGALIVFKKRAGIVVLHLGVIVLMVSELHTGMTAVESRMTIPENETVNYAEDIRAAELAVVDHSDDKEDVHTVIPASRLSEGAEFEGDGLPLKIRIHKYFPNSVRQPAKDGDNLATRGFGLDEIAEPTLRATGARVDMSSVYAELFAPDGKSLGTWLLSQHHVTSLQKTRKQDVVLSRKKLFSTPAAPLLSRPGVFKQALRKVFDEHQVALSEGWEIVKYSQQDGANEFLISVGPRRYLLEQRQGLLTVHEARYVSVALRFKRSYKPFSIYLIDARKDDYIGTNMPMNYSSDIRMVDKANNVDRKLRIWMNNPLRYAGETYYQADYHEPPVVSKVTTVLQVVTNDGWMVPYIACMIIATGMLYQFWLVLLRFLNRMVRPSPPVATAFSAHVPAGGQAKHQAHGESRPARRTHEAPPALSGPGESRAAEIAAWIIPPAVVFGAIVWVGILYSKAGRPMEHKMDIKAFGSLPVVADGRSKPFDTLARNNLLSISKKATVEVDREKIPAIEWFLDHIARPEVADKYEVIRIENMQVAATLDLGRKKRFRYAYESFRDETDEFMRQAREANAQHPKKRDLHQRKILNLHRRITTYTDSRFTFALPPPDRTGGLTIAASYLIPVSRRVKNLETNVSLGVPSRFAKHGWETVVVAAARIYIKDKAREWGITDDAGQRSRRANLRRFAREFASRLTSRELQPLLKTPMLRRLKETMRQIRNITDPDELDRRAKDAFDNLPSSVRSNLERMTWEGEVRPLVERNLQDAAEKILGSSSLNEDELPATRSLIRILAAYRDDDAEAFNAGIKEYRKLLAETPPPLYDSAKVDYEGWLNNFGVFHAAMGFYIVAFVLTCLSWSVTLVGWRVPVSRAALWLIATVFVLHTFALVSRIYLMGRPPVTNLYSSAVFIGWAAVVLGLILEMVFRLGIGNAIAAVSGFATLYIAGYLAEQGEDTMKVLQAVLDTQFWLMTHVICITLGYATTFFAGLLGMAYVVAGVCTPTLATRLRNDNLGRTLARMIYGTLCFAIFFSVVGTILGGLWADDSWGRFWGWDPKENGALIIVLWNALVLHARWDGMAKERGLAVLAIGGNIVTAWSWFGVNELQVGLHSYGFTEGVLIALLAWWGLCGLVIIAGCLPKKLWFSEIHKSSQRNT